MVSLWAKWKSEKCSQIWMLNTPGKNKNTWSDAPSVNKNTPIVPLTLKLQINCPNGRSHDFGVRYDEKYLINYEALHVIVSHFCVQSVLNFHPTRSRRSLFLSQHLFYFILLGYAILQIELSCAVGGVKASEVAPCWL